MSRYCIKGRWYTAKPNSRLRYDSSSESEPEKGKDAKKVDQLNAINPKQSIIETPKQSAIETSKQSAIEAGSNCDANIPSKENLSQSKVVKPKTERGVRKNLNL